MDRISKEHRSWNMSRIRSSNTKPEITVRSILHGLGYRFRLHARELPGRPDIVLPKHHAVIFVNGCFWHRHVGCPFAYTPKSRTEFWDGKFRETIERDVRNLAELAGLNWRTLTVWECETRDTAALVRQLKVFLQHPEQIVRAKKNEQEVEVCEA